MPSASLFGVWIARFVGLLSADAPAGETLGVGLASGLLVLAAWWAAIASGGRSSFTPVAIGFAIALGLAAVRRWRPARARRHRPECDECAAIAGPPIAHSRRRDLSSMVGGALFVVAVALLYGSTMALSPRDGVQPLEFNDEAYYSVLGADLAKTGTETIYSPSGFDQIDGSAGPDLVPLGRAVARVGRHLGLRHAPARMPATSSSCRFCCWRPPR